MTESDVHFCMDSCRDDDVVVGESVYLSQVKMRINEGDRVEYLLSTLVFMCELIADISRP